LVPKQEGRKSHRFRHHLHFWRNEYTILAKKEVIISGGTVNTPQILEPSGIGAKAVLDKAGINQIVDLPSVVHKYQLPQMLS